MDGPYYVRSTDGDNADSGLTWALAKATLAGALAVAAAGERIWVSQAHAETQASSMTLTSAGTVAAPVEILCGNDAAEPPTELATTATVTTTGASSISILNSLYCYGITFACATGSAASIQLTWNTTNQRQTYENCTFKVLDTNVGTLSAGVTGGSQPGILVRLINCIVVFNAIGQQFQQWGGLTEIIGGSFALTGTVPTTLIRSGSLNGRLRLRGVDLSAFGTGKNLINVGSGEFTVTLEQCKLGSSVTLKTGTPAGGVRVALDNADSTDTQYRMQRHGYEGDTYSETTIVRTGGASDGTTPLSHKMVSSAGAKFVAPLYGPEFWIHNAATGASKTVTVEIIHDSVTALTDAEVWLEVEALNTSGFPISSFTTDRAADILATPANQTASSETWTTTGLTNPNKQKLAVTFTPQEVGIFRCRVALAKASYTCYVDPLATVS